MEFKFNKNNQLGFCFAIEKFQLRWKKDKF